MDGNGRWAQQRGLPRNEGHRQGVENVKRILEGASECGLKFLTLFAFSCENWRRPAEEVGALMRLLEIYLKTQTKDLHKNRIRLRTIGRIEELPPVVLKLLRDTEEATRHYDNWTLVLALNYGTRTEVVDAVKNWYQAVQAGTADPDALDWEALNGYLYTKDIPDPDLIIRTSGESRVSNFLLLQGAYAEFYFTQKHWPDFTNEDLRLACEWYGSRERRFGRTGEQVRSLQTLNRAGGQS